MCSENIRVIRCLSYLWQYRFCVCNCHCSWLILHYVPNLFAALIGSNALGLVQKTESEKTCTFETRMFPFGSRVTGDTICQSFAWNISSSRKIVGSPPYSCSRILQIKLFSMSCVFGRSNSNNLWRESRWICSFGLMPTCNPVRKYTVLQCWPRIFSNSMSQMFCWDALHTSQTRSEEVWLPKTTYLACHHLLSTAIGLPIHGDWDYGTRCVQMTKKHVALSLASNTNLPNMTLLVLWLVNSWWNFGSTIGRPMLGLDLQTSDIAMRFFLSCAQWWALVVWHCSQHVNSFFFGFDFDDAPMNIWT